MRRLYSILIFAYCFFLFVPLQAQIVQPVTWSGEQIGDSVKLTAVFEKGWHMTLISIGDEEIGEEIFESPYVLTFAKSEVPAIRFNACTGPAGWQAASS